MENRTYNKIIIKNEENANKTAAKVMTITFVGFTLVYILNLLGIFIIDMIPMSVAYAVSSILLLLPNILNRAIGTESRALKYIYVVFAAMFVLMITSALTHHVVVLYIFPVAISLIYFSQKLTRISTILTVFVTICGQLIGHSIGRLDDNFLDMKSLLLYGVFPRTIILICLSSLLEHVASRTAELLKEDAENYEQQVRYGRNMVYGFATLVENRDESTGGHIKRTSLYAEILARKLKEKGLYSDIITEDFISYIATVAPLHDIGKIAIPDDVLCKPGKLNDEEFDIMKSHSAKGGEIIRETFSGISDEDYKEMAYEVAHSHHEKWNGRGYPDGISGEEIPLAARIMAVADVFDAVSQKRCYREAMPLEQCFDIISEGIGRDFDPVIAETFLELRDKITKIVKAEELL